MQQKCSAPRKTMRPASLRALIRTTRLPAGKWPNRRHRRDLHCQADRKRRNRQILSRRPDLYPWWNNGSKPFHSGARMGLRKLTAIERRSLAATLAVRLPCGLDPPVEPVPVPVHWPILSNRGIFARRIRRRGQWDLTDANQANLGSRPPR
jgi:hypothetical protein